MLIYTKQTFDLEKKFNDLETNGVNYVGEEEAIDKSMGNMRKENIELEKQFEMNTCREDLKNLSVLNEELKVKSENLVEKLSLAGLEFNPLSKQDLFVEDFDKIMQNYNERKINEGIKNQAHADHSKPQIGQFAPIIKEKRHSSQKFNSKRSRPDKEDLFDDKSNSYKQKSDYITSTPRNRLDSECDQYYTGGSMGKRQKKGESTSKRSFNFENKAQKYLNNSLLDDQTQMITIDDKSPDNSPFIDGGQDYTGNSPIFNYYQEIQNPNYSNYNKENLNKDHHNNKKFSGKKIKIIDEGSRFDTSYGSRDKSRPSYGSRDKTITHCSNHNNINQFQYRRRSSIIAQSYDEGTTFQKDKYSSLQDHDKKIKPTEKFSKERAIYRSHAGKKSSIKKDEQAKHRKSLEKISREIKYTEKNRSPPSIETHQQKKATLYKRQRELEMQRRQMGKKNVNEVHDSNKVQERPSIKYRARQSNKINNGNLQHNNPQYGNLSDCNRHISNIDNKNSSKLAIDNEIKKQRITKNKLIQNYLKNIGAGENSDDEGYVEPNRVVNLKYDDQSQNTEEYQRLKT